MKNIAQHLKDNIFIFTQTDINSASDIYINEAVIYPCYTKITFIASPILRNLLWISLDKELEK